MKNLKIKMAAAAVCLLGTAASINAASIASESFEVNAGLAGTYVSGTLAAEANKSVLVGNSGFSAQNAWRGETARVNVSGDKSLSFHGLVGPALTGSVNVSTHSNGLSRGSARLLRATPAASTYYFSALVAGAGNQLAVDEAMSIGMGKNTQTLLAFNIADGIHFGLTGGEAGYNKLVAYAGGNTYDLLTIAVNDVETRQVVLKLDTNVADGNDYLSVWYAGENGTVLTEGIANINVGNIYNSGSDLLSFIIQSKSGTTSTNNKVMGYFDEMRLGTALADVTTLNVVPESSSVALILGGAATSVMLLLRRRRKVA